MKKYNKILEAVDRGIQLALDDFDDEEVQNIKSKQIQNRDYTKEYLDLMNEAVDLGLPSGTKWFKYNLGVNYKKLNINSENSMPEDWYGNYYAWGETEPNKPKYTLTSYKWKNNKQITIKYNSTDNLEELLPEDDAAQQFNKMLRIPTVDECLELLNNTNKECVYDYNGIKGLNGYLISNRKDSNKHIFIPAAGLINGSKRIQDEDAILITNERLDGIKCRTLTFEESQYTYANTNLPAPQGYIKSMKRICGCSIRPVINL